MGRRVLITGVASDLATLLARDLEQRDDVDYVVGVDVREPRGDLQRTEFVRADIRNPLVARLITATDVDTVVHMSVAPAPASVGGRTRMKEQNVIGTMQLLAACQKAEALRKVVVKSSTAVYGSDYADPALFREDVTPRELPNSGYGKDMIEIEGYARGFGRRRRDATLTILRFANFVGPHVDSAMTRYFSLPVVPSVLGYDPRLQLCHEDDALGVLRRSITEDHPGTFNVAGPGVLYLSQAARIAGRVPVPVALPFVNLVAAFVKRSRRIDFSPEQLRFLQFGRAGDITRLREDFGYEPRYSTRAAFEDFVARRRIRGIIDRDAAARLERELFDFIQRKSGEPAGARGTST